jgi:hypothetical protein
MLDLILRIEPTVTVDRWWSVGVRSLTNALAEAERLLARY